MNIKDLVKNGSKVYFNSYRHGIFYYDVVSIPDFKVAESGIPIYPEGKAYTFPVPLEDVEGATLLAEDKALTYMRWIRKAIADKTLIEVK